MPQSETMRSLTWPWCDKMGLSERWVMEGGSSFPRLVSFVAPRIVRRASYRSSRLVSFVAPRSRASADSRTRSMTLKQSQCAIIRHHANTSKPAPRGARHRQASPTGWIARDIASAERRARLEARSRYEARRPDNGKRNSPLPALLASLHIARAARRIVPRYFFALSLNNFAYCP